MTAKAPALLLLAATALLLAGCTTPAANDGGSTDSGSDDSSSQSSGIDAKGTPCEDNTSGITLFSDASISQSDRKSVV